MRKYIPLFLILSMSVIYFIFNPKDLKFFSPIFVICLISIIIGLFIWMQSRKKLSPETYAKDFAKLIKKMIDRRMIFGVFVFNDGWWRLFCVQSENDEDGEYIGEWTLPEVQNMVENGLSMLFKDGHLDKKFLVKGVADVNVGYVDIEELDISQSIGINITYDDENKKD